MSNPIPVRFANHPSGPTPSYHLLELPPDLYKLIESNVGDLRFVETLKDAIGPKETRY